jgi:hypothetical protein
LGDVGNRSRARSEVHVGLMDGQRSPEDGASHEFAPAHPPLPDTGLPEEKVRVL